ncbi:MAG TPA: hypothetical protein VIX19_11610 [Terriglobales bacterium]
MATPVVTLTFDTTEDAALMSYALTAYLRLYAIASSESQAICEAAVISIHDQLRNPPEPPEPEGPDR